MYEDKTEDHPEEESAELKVSKTRSTATGEGFGQCELRLDQILESLPYPFYVIDASDYTIKAANAAAGFGPLPDASTCYALTHNRYKPCGSAAHPCPIQKIRETRGPVTVEHVHCDKDGKPRNVEGHAFPVFDHKGEVSQIIEYVLDITERKRAEDALQKAHDELERRVEERTAELRKSYEERAFIQETFGTYLSDEVVTEILASPEGMKLGGETRDMTVLLSDLRKFTSVTASEIVAFE